MEDSVKIILAERRPRENVESSITKKTYLAKVTSI
jgi:hypothetical protein